MSASGRPRSSKEVGQVPWRRLHLWEIQPVRDLLLLAALFGLLYLGYKIRLVTVPLLLALLLAYLFEPVVNWLTDKFRWLTRRMAAGGMIALTAIVVIVPLTLASAWGIAEGTRFAIGQTNNAANFVLFVNRTFPPAAKPAAAAQEEQTPSTEATGEQQADIPTDDGLMPPLQSDGTGDAFQADEKHSADFYYDQLTSEAWRWAARTLRKQKDDDTARKVAAFIGSLKPVPSMAQVRGYISGIASSIVASISLIGLFGFQLFLTAFFFFFVSSNYERVIEFIKNLLPENKKAGVIDLARKMDKVIAGFVRGRLVIALIQGAIFSVAYLLMGVPAAILLGFAVGMLSIVPYLALIGIPISMLLLLLDGPDSGFRSLWWFTVFAPIVVYFVVQALDDYVWTPMIQGKQTGLDTPTVLFASIAGGALAGFYGLLIAIPVAACLKILVQEVVWPRFKQWREGKVEDPLPLGGRE